MADTQSLSASSKFLQHPSVVLARELSRRTFWPFDRNAREYTLDGLDVPGQLAPALGQLGFRSYLRLSTGPVPSLKALSEAPQMKALKALLLAQKSSSAVQMQMAFGEVMGLDALSVRMPDHPLLTAALSRLPSELTSGLSRLSKIAVLQSQRSTERGWVPLVLWQLTATTARLDPAMAEMTRLIRAYERRTFLTDGQPYLTAPRSAAGLWALVALEAARHDSDLREWFLLNERNKFAATTMALAGHEEMICVHDQIVIAELALAAGSLPALLPKELIQKLLPLMGAARYADLWKGQTPKTALVQALPAWLAPYLMARAPSMPARTKHV